MSGPRRGRGESSKVTKIEEEDESKFQGVRRPGSSLPILDVEDTGSSSSNDHGSGEGSGNGSGSGSSGAPVVRGRGGFKAKELRTIPEGITEVKAKVTGHQMVNIMTNFVRINAMEKREVHQYRVDFEPNVENVSVRVRLFRQATKDLFKVRVTFDGMSDARSSHKTPSDKNEFTLEDPQEPSKKIKIKVKRVGEVAWGSFEMIRLYNMHMKQFLKALGFFSVSKTGAFVHEALSSPIGSNNALMTVRGYRTGANIHERGQILMNLESVHKLMQKQNVLRNMMEIKNQGGNVQATAKAALTGKLVVTRYNKIVYRIEDINFSMTPMSTFFDRRANKDITYCEYYTQRYNVTINDTRQPLLLVIPNTQRQNQPDDGHQIYLIPELCNIAGLTDAQRNDNRLKIDLIRCSQIPPTDRVNHLMTFLKKLHECNEVSTSLKEWGYSYDTEPVKIQGRILPTEAIAMGRTASQPPDRWTKVDQSASFDQAIQRETVAKAPANFTKLAIVIGRTEMPNEGRIAGKLRTGMDRVGSLPGGVTFARIQEGDSANHFSRELRQLPGDISAAIVIMTNQNKERYDAIKKLATVERGLITQVVTSKLMMDDRKAGGAAIKIGIQLAAKLGGEPWYVNIPLTTAMICGYDTYHDTANRGRSYGAFVASMNGKYSRWWSKADSHERLDELSSHMTENLTLALQKYHTLNKKFPDRLIVYRDGVGDGQLEHVFNVEVKDIKKAVVACDPKIRLTFIIVNKRIGARFYMKSQKGFDNPPPGTVIDDTVTRQERYDFYLISQSTRHGTVTPTYYNIIHDESGLDASKHQMMAYKLCFMYYNWTGTVRVPAPCQYAHKLALLCGEHLHSVPNVTLDDRLHFL